MFFVKKLYLQLRILNSKYCEYKFILTEKHQKHVRKFQWSAPTFIYLLLFVRTNLRIEEDGGAIKNREYAQHL